MQLQKRSGMTLAEVIISLIILSVVVVSILGFFSQGYLSTLQSRASSKENYEVQTYFEEQMAEAKKNGAGGDETIPFNFEVKDGGDGGSGSIDVMGKTLSYSNSTIRLFLSNQKEATLELPENLSAIIEGAEPYYYVGGRIPNGKAESEVDTVDNIKTDMEEAWFLSHRKVGEQGVVPVGNLVTKKDSDTPMQLVRPVMSNTTRDVAVIKKSNTGLTVTDKMRGKYLTFGARVYSTFGRVGQYHVAEPIWIMGIPITNGLEAHTDVDLAVSADQGPIPVTTTPTANGSGTRVLNYRDKIQYKGNIPVFNVYEEHLKQTRQFIAFQGDRMWFTNRNLTRGETVSMLIGNKKQSGSLVSFELGTGASNAWQPTLRWSLNLAEDGRMTTTVDDPSNLNLAIGFKDVGQEALDYSQDHSVQIRTTKVAGEWAMLIEVFIDGQSVHSEKVLYRGVTSGKVVEHNHEAARLVLGGDTYINEFAIYTRSLRDSEIGTLATYFKGKYDTTYNAEQP